MKVVLSPLQRLRGDSASPVAQFIYVFKCIPSFVTFTAAASSVLRNQGLAKLPQVPTAKLIFLLL